MYQTIDKTHYSSVGLSLDNASTFVDLTSTSANGLLDRYDTSLHLSLCCEQATDAFLLSLSKPGLLSLTKYTFTKIVDKMADHDQNKCNRI